MKGLSEEKIRQLLATAESQKNERDICLYGSLLESQIEDINPWREIGTAPKDRRILLFYPDARVKIMGGVWNAVNVFFIPDIAINNRPSHWRELPAPPNLGPRKTAQSSEIPPMILNESFQ